MKMKLERRRKRKKGIKKGNNRSSILSHKKNYNAHTRTLLFKLNKKSPQERVDFYNKQQKKTKKKCRFVFEIFEVIFNCDVKGP